MTYIKKHCIERFVEVLNAAVAVDFVLSEDTASFTASSITKDAGSNA